MLEPSHGPAVPPPEVFLYVTPPEVFQLPDFSESLFRRRWLSNRDEIHFAWDDAIFDESWDMVSVKVANVSLYAAVAVARLARASTVLGNIGHLDGHHSPTLVENGIVPGKMYFVSVG